MKHTPNSLLVVYFAHFTMGTIFEHCSFTSFAVVMVSPLVGRVLVCCIHVWRCVLFLVNDVFLLLTLCQCPKQVQELFKLYRATSSNLDMVVYVLCNMRKVHIRLVQHVRRFYAHMCLVRIPSPPPPFFPYPLNG